MDTHSNEGEAVLEQLSQPCALTERRTASLWSHVRGEFEDEDGDWATGFIVADVVPTRKSNPSSCPQLSKLNHVETQTRGNFSGAVDATGSSHDFAVSESGHEDDKVEFRLGRSSCSLSNAAVPMPIGEDGCERKRGTKLDQMACLANTSDEAIFTCEICGNWCCLNELNSLFSCNCLLCNSCCRRHVENSLAYLPNNAGTGNINWSTLAGPFTPGHGIEKKRRMCTRGMLRDGVHSDMSLISTKKGKKATFRATAFGFSETRLYVDLTGEAKSGSEVISCLKSHCYGSLQLSAAQQFAPEAFSKWEEERLRFLFDKSDNYTTCPSCKIPIEKVPESLHPGIALTGVPELDRTAPFVEFDIEGKQLTRSAICHRATHRFRCTMCSADFCGQCMHLPYHLGRTCEEAEEEKNSIKCLYCDTPVRDLINEAEPMLPVSVRELRKELDREQVDATWCVEKKDLFAVRKLALSVCPDKDCRRRIRSACTRKLECGHHCGGVRGERICLPCLEGECQLQAPSQSRGHYLPSADDDCSICLVEPLRRAPSIQLNCGHVVHLDCAKKKVENGFPGPKIGFGYLSCPQCPEVMNHQSLSSVLKEPLGLMMQVRDKAYRRLKMDGLLRTSRELKPGGRFEGRPTDFALHLYSYYLCSKCSTPYFGGQRDCAENNVDGNGQILDPKSLICGGCSSALGGQELCTRGHGKEFVEFKCRFCCSIATYYCFGSTHFCERCHVTRPDANPAFVPVHCRGAKWCKLNVSHAPNGKEFCLGCSICRLDGQ